jgi:hypothetical protein
LSLAQAVALVERVRASAARGAHDALAALAAAVPVPIASIAIRQCPRLPPTTEERIADNLLVVSDVMAVDGYTIAPAP